MKAQELIDELKLQLKYLRWYTHSLATAIAVMAVYIVKLQLSC